MSISERWRIARRREIHEQRSRRGEALFGRRGDARGLVSLEVVENEGQRLDCDGIAGAQPVLGRLASVPYAERQIDLPRGGMHPLRDDSEQHVFAAMTPRSRRQQARIVYTGDSRECQHPLRREAQSRVPAPVDALSERRGCRVRVGGEPQLRPLRQRQQLQRQQRRAGIAAGVIMGRRRAHRRRTGRPVQLRGGPRPAVPPLPLRTHAAASGKPSQRACSAIGSIAAADSAAARLLLSYQISSSARLRRRIRGRRAPDGEAR